MALYIVLCNFTEQGVRTLKDTTKRAKAITEMAWKFGVTTKAFFWTLGSYDVVHIYDAPDDTSMAAVLARASVLPATFVP